MIDKKKILELSDNLNKIPHLNLTNYLKTVPLEKILGELSQFSNSDFYPYHNGQIREEFLNFLKSHWKGMCLIENCKEGKHHTDYRTTDDHQLTFYPEGECHPTDVGLLMPETIKYLYSIIKKPQRTRLLKILPNGEAGWHSHYELDKSGVSTIDGVKLLTPVIHIPLLTNPNVYMAVSKTNPRFDETARLHKKHYAVGEVWLFNSYHYHNVYNKGTTDRDHIMMYVELDDQFMFPIIAKAVEEYDGVRI